MTTIERARALWLAVRGDGCTSAPDIHVDYHACCNRHDADYRTHTDETGKPISRYRADQRLRACMKAYSKTFAGRWFITPLYFLAVRTFGGKFWNKKQEKFQ